MRRVRSRMRFAADHLDPNELLQDAIINVYSYPDRFEAARAGAFRAWSSTIVDNSIRRKLRQRRSGPDVALSPTEILAQHPDATSRQPFLRVMHGEDLRNTVQAYGLFLQFYLAAYLGLSERERFVLQMVEVRRMRYAELAQHMGIRPKRSRWSCSAPASASRRRSESCCPSTKTSRWRADERIPASGGPSCPGVRVGGSRGWGLG